MSSLITPVHVESTGGLPSWFRRIGGTITGWPAFYRAAYRSNPRRVILLTLMVIGIFVYPIVYQAIPSAVTRALPIPSSTVVVFMLIFGIMAIGLNIVIGFAGLLDLGYVAFYAIGAYTAAFLASPHFGGVSLVLFSGVPAGFPGIHLPFVLILLVAAGVAATFGALLGAPTLRLRGDYLAIVTLGFGEIVPIFFKNLVNVNFTFGPIILVNANITGGPLGINPIDAPGLFGIKFGVISGWAPVYLGIGLVIVAIVIARNLERSRMGRAWMAIREDEIAAEMMGVNTVRTKLLAFALGASFAGVAGALQASYQGATTSDFFMFSTSILVVIMIILGGIGNIWGVLLGAVVVQYVDKTLLGWIGNRLTDVGNFTGLEQLGDINPSSFSFLLLGIALVAMMRFRPEGFLPSRQRAAEMHTAPPGQAIGSIGLLEEEGVIEELDPTEPGGVEDAEMAEVPGEEPVGQTIAESRDEVTDPDEETPR